MHIKIVLGVALAICLALAGAGWAFVGSNSQCCTPGATCCPDGPCCDDDCCYPGADCCPDCVCCPDCCPVSGPSCPNVKAASNGSASAGNCCER